MNTLTKSSFDRGDRAIWIRNTALELMVATRRHENYASAFTALQEATDLWDRFMEMLPPKEEEFQPGVDS